MKSSITKRYNLEKRFYIGLKYFVLGSGSFIALTPLLYMMATSLKTYGQTISRVSSNPFHPYFWPQLNNLQWGNYTIAWNQGMQGYFLNSFVISFITLIGIFFTTIPAAYAFSKLKFRGKNAIFTILLMTLMIPETVLTIPNYLTVASFGWIDKLPALTIPFIASAFHIFLLRQFFNQIPSALLESATIDGAGTFTSMIRIAVPLSKAPLFTIAFLGFTGAWNALQWPLVVTLTDRWRPLTVGLIKFMTEAGPESHLRMAGASIALLPVVILYIVAQRQITDAVARSGVKG